jgi:hypothetical protein
VRSDRIRGLSELNHLETASIVVGPSGHPDRPRAASGRPRQPDSRPGDSHGFSSEARRGRSRAPGQYHSWLRTRCMLLKSHLDKSHPRRVVHEVEESFVSSQSLWPRVLRHSVLRYVRDNYVTLQPEANTNDDRPSAQTGPRRRVLSRHIADQRFRSGQNPPNDATVEC